MRILLALMSLIALCSCGGGAGDAKATNAVTPTPSPVAASGKIYIFGDDVAKGEGATVPYWKTIETRTGKTVVDRAYSHVSGSVYGAPGGYGTYNNDLDLNNNNLRDIVNSDIIIIFTGQSDVRWYGDFQNSQSVANRYTAFFNAAYATGAQIYAVSPVKMNAAKYASFTPLNRGSDAYMTNVATGLQNLVLSYHSSGVKYVEMTANFNPTAGNLQADLQFPNNAGHLIIANKILADMGY